MKSETTKKNVILGENCFLLHTLVGSYPSNFTSLMYVHKRNYDYAKFPHFAHFAGNTLEEVEKGMGLDLREIICCASKKSPAVTYHKSFGLILSGDIKKVYDGDSALCMNENGEYPLELPYGNTKETTLEHLMGSWYEDFKKTDYFHWNEVILNKGAHIVGAFHDPRYKPSFTRIDYRQDETQEKVYEKFLKKVDMLGLDLLEIEAKFLL